ncbi:MAG: HAD-IIA family hydrolase [Actinobacteria bacterium]|jgi:HAD superfamily hydrolase (TIGR01450 family)|nr:HAD-IIA family hydrolase [Actinomycetota bacterium]MBT3746044.1 HAD-IIA family hydrolase [Actinomycetota bacterium]MBT3969472.1 HAD-IIA family hydrolase [Actinomycetota bacterium]MBT4008957.1 HAD-IIA family hydrolase [Actinomycetota bacterium]MBT4303750.1 HAD-IIA family hydrolase [Actinomycetota bacterium]
MGWALDLDGVVWLGTDRIPGVGEAVTKLQDAGETVLFVTNNSGSRIVDLEARLAHHGIDARGGVISSAMAAAKMVEPGERILGMCGPGCREELEAQGAVMVDDGPVDTVVVGFHEHFDYWGLSAGIRAVLGGARLLATNTDVTYPAEDGIRAGAGSIVAALVAATGVTPEVAGKPHQAICDLVIEAAGPEGIVVGDRPDTDGLLAQALNWKFALVLSGVTTEEHLPITPTPASIHADLPALIAEYLQ